MKDTGEVLRVIRNITNDKEFNDYADKAAMKMVTNLFRDGGRTWRDAAKQNSKGKLIYEALKKEIHSPIINGSMTYQISRNADLIKTIPNVISGKITTHIAEESLKGRRAIDIFKDIRAMVPHLTDVEAKRIARTEVSKTSTALTQARSENLGLNWYIWRTCEDTRVRKSHDHMEGVLVCWDNPPSPEKLIGKKHIGYYHAGNIYNCRCYPEPVVTLELISWPCKVYWNGKIQGMSRKQFENIFK